MTRHQRATCAYIVSNLWEVALSAAFCISTIGNLATRNNQTSISAIWGDPWDTAIIILLGIASLSVFAGLIVWLPRIRAAGLVLLAGMLVVLAVSAVHKAGLAAASYGLGAYAALAAAAVGRALGIIWQGDYPPLRRRGDFPRTRRR